MELFLDTKISTPQHFYFGLSIVSHSGDVQIVPVFFPTGLLVTHLLHLHSQLHSTTKNKTKQMANLKKHAIIV